LLMGGSSTRDRRLRAGGNALDARRVSRRGRERVNHYKEKKGKRRMEKKNVFFFKGATTAKGEARIGEICVIRGPGGRRGSSEKKKATPANGSIATL